MLIETKCKFRSHLPEQFPIEQGLKPTAPKKVRRHPQKLPEQFPIEQGLKLTGTS